MGCHHLKIRAKQGTGKGDREKKEGLPESTTIDDEQRTDDSDGRASQAKKKGNTIQHAYVPEASSQRDGE
jgi:hypothetical protein